MPREPRIVTVVPNRWHHRGEAVARENHHDLLVWNGIVGEEARVRITHPGQNRDYGLFVEPYEPSPHRVDPPCDRFHACGGCPLMHVDKDGQQDARVSLVRRALYEFELDDVEIKAFHDSPDGMADFRHIVKLGTDYSEQGALRVGAWGRNTRRIVPIPKCVVATPELRKVMASVAHFVRKLDLRAYDPDTGRGTLRAVVLRQSRTTKEVIVTLSACRRPKVLNEFADAVMGSNSEVVGVTVHVNTNEGNSIWGRDEDGRAPWRALGGRPWIEEEINGIRYRIGPTDFFQTNPSMAVELYNRTLKALKLDKDIPFLDLYCGVGGLALQAAKITGWALGVEEGMDAIMAARDSAQRNHVPAEFISGRTEDVLPDLQKRLAKARPVISVNPARRGLEPGVVDQLVALKPRRIAYISCNPQALARDLAQFRAAGYRVAPLELFDMFPNTAHVETLAVLEAPDADSAVGRVPKRRIVRR